MARSRPVLAASTWLITCAFLTGASPMGKDGKSGAVPADAAPGSGDLDVATSEMRDLIERCSSSRGGVGEIKRLWFSAG
jgi:hypothetical protein